MCVPEFRKPALPDSTSRRILGTIFVPKKNEKARKEKNNSACCQNLYSAFTSHKGRRETVVKTVNSTPLFISDSRSASRCAHPLGGWPGSPPCAPPAPRPGRICTKSIGGRKNGRGNNGQLHIFSCRNSGRVKSVVFSCCETRGTPKKKKNLRTDL